MTLETGFCLGLSSSSPAASIFCCPLTWCCVWGTPVTWCWLNGGFCKQSRLSPPPGASVTCLHPPSARASYRSCDQPHPPPPAQRVPRTYHCASSSSLSLSCQPHQLKGTTHMETNSCLTSQTCRPPRKNIRRLALWTSRKATCPLSSHLHMALSLPHAHQAPRPPEDVRQGAGPPAGITSFCHPWLFSRWYANQSSSIFNFLFQMVSYFKCIRGVLLGKESLSSVLLTAG